MVSGHIHGNLPLFETRRAKGRALYRVFAASVFVCVVLIWVYRAIHIPGPGEDGRLGWIGLLLADLWFGLYWILTQALRWNRVYRNTFKDRLSQRHEEELPKVDIFVCTADPVIEPPVMVINTVLSVMAYDYPKEKLSVYLSDDGGSDLTFYALLEASRFAKHWIPFCKKFNVEPRSPAAYFASGGFGGNGDEEVAKVKILIDGRDPNAKDIEGCAFPTLVYLAREKRPQHHHNFKAGAMNALIRVSSEISNGQIILNVDCDMYSNNSSSVRDALCFFMDEEKGNEIAFVQFPQKFDNATKNDIYGSTLRVICEVEFSGLDGYGGPLYIGTGCFHRRDILCGRKFTKGNHGEAVSIDCFLEGVVLKYRRFQPDLPTLEKSSQLPRQIGLRYGCPVEDVITGLSIQCLGWKSVYYNPEREGFLGVAPTSLDQTLLQHKRWSEGDLQILLSRYSPAWYGLGRISPGLQMGYCTYCLWAPNSLATMFYSVVPSLYLLRGVSLFPQVSSPWFLPFAYVIIAMHFYSLVEFMWSGGTVLGWWNEQRMWLYKRTSSYLFAFNDTISRLAGFSETTFIVTNKVSDPDVSQRYELEMMEFGTTFPMFTILATLAMLNLISLVWVVKKILTQVGIRFCEAMALQLLLCWVLVLVNWPLYRGLFLRKDNGKMPSSVTVKSAVLALCVCACSVLLY
ncbi:cellulose synthase like E1 [Actinidia rufa]|uniref:Cellulose synthase like E1 n=1 Tax=Actinidia rufa TaxID=165716 RepID=A0A7J0GP84_9ERIC|nr:cellulose synthase like E1 [Actinidia rufa]